MKLCRYGRAGEEKPGIVDDAGAIRDLSFILADLTPDTLSPEGLARLREVAIDDLPLAPADARYGVPVAGTRKFIAIGLNYADHAAESNLPIPSEPVVFNKWITCLQGPNDPITIPKGSLKTDWEVELGVVIGTGGHNIDEADALSHVAGYCVVNDVSERHWQLERGPTWDKGKGFPTFGPVGPWLVTHDEVGDPQNLALWLDVNGKRVQDGNTATMIFSVAEIVAYCSSIMMLEAGDIITTGTPPGVGMGQKPEPCFLKAGDVVRLGIDKLGEQRQEFRQGS
ncbi:fumarylacetoacetate hydrolase family protein [Sphingomonas sp. ASY06-1R]|jgi:ureidoglycolate lyase|uniref:fumarylacetoacetate hydrolase family protein n=1 Tax=Sphingomonas sp. ASY06-1R TaxID=3445771 RepID=UPI003FA23AA6